MASRVETTVNYLAFSSDDKTVAAGWMNGHLDLIDVTNASSVVALQVSDGPVLAVAFLPGKVRVVAERKSIDDPKNHTTIKAFPARLVDFVVPSPNP